MKERTSTYGPRYSRKENVSVQSEVLINIIKTREDIIEWNWGVEHSRFETLGREPST